MKVPFTTSTASEEMIEELREQGHSSFPVVVVDGDESWSFSGYRHAEIARLAELFR